MEALWQPPPEAPPPTSGRLIDEVAYLAGRGPAGLAELRARIEGAHGAAWVREIPLSAPVMRGHVRTTLRYLLEEVQVNTVNAVTNGNSPLHMATIWGRLDCCAYLLAHGADLHLLCDRGMTAAEKARIRLERLTEKLAECEAAETPWRSDGTCIGRADISRLCGEGRQLVQFFDEVEAAGSYAAWRRACPQNRLARSFPTFVSSAESRLRLCVARSLVGAGRAELRPPGLVAEEVPDGSAGGDPRESAPTLEAVLEAAGLIAVADELQALGPFADLAELCAARLTRHAVWGLHAREADLRRLWRFIVEGQQAQEAQRLQQTPAKRTAAKRQKQDGKADARARALAAATVSAQKVAKAKADQGGPGPGSSGPAAPAVAPGAGRAAPESRAAWSAGLELLFNPHLPLGAFANIAVFLY